VTPWAIEENKEWGRNRGCVPHYLSTVPPQRTSDPVVAMQADLKLTSTPPALVICTSAYGSHSLCP